MTMNNKSERNYRGKCLGWPVTSYGAGLTFLNKHQILSIDLMEDFSQNSVNISDCRAFSLFETVTGSLISQVMSEFDGIDTSSIKSNRNNF